MQSIYPTNDKRFSERDVIRFRILQNDFDILVETYGQAAIKMKELLAFQGHEWAVMTKYEDGVLQWESEEDIEEYMKADVHGNWDISSLTDDGFTASNSGETLYTLELDGGVCISDKDTGLEFSVYGVSLWSIKPEQFPDHLHKDDEGHWRKVAQTANGFFEYGLGWGIEWAVEAMIRGMRKEEKEKAELEMDEITLEEV